MKIGRHVLAALFILVVGALAVLLVIQFRLLEKDIENNKRVMEQSLPRILSDLYDNMMFNQDLRKYTDHYQGTDNFAFSSDSHPTDSLQIVLKSALDRVLELNYPELHYELDGFVSNEFGCVIHRHHRPDLPKAQRVMDAQNHLCFCMVLNNTLDIALSYTNEEAAVIGESASFLRISLVLILFIFSAFGYTLYTIRKQKKLSDLKRDFVNNLTHEFKTPIFSISLATRSLKERDETKLSEKMMSYVNLIGTETRRLQTQVDKILQIALIDSGHLTLEKKEMDLHAIIKNVAESFSIIIAEKQGHVQLNLNASRHMIFADETHLNNIVYNLIDNAQKYSEGNPDIQISTEDAMNNGIILTIKDKGIGMDKPTQKYIFDQFYRAQRGDVHTVKGFGLGLSYVKRIIEFHKGTINLTSAPGSGSEFKIFLPQS